MIPRFPGRSLRLSPCVLDRNPVVPVDTLLLHRDSVQVSLFASTRALGQTQLLAGGLHALELALQVSLPPLPLLPPEEEPGAVDCPVAKVSVAAHPEGRGQALRREQLELFKHADELGIAFYGAVAFALCPSAARRLLFGRGHLGR